MNSQLQVSRYELKYVISEPRALAIRDVVGGYLEPDQHMPPDDPNGYRVTSLYLDGPRWELYQQTQDGVKNRFKLRLRFYDQAADAPVFVEVKHRITDTLHKERVAVTRTGVAQLLAGQLVDPAEVLQADEAAQRALRSFRSLSERIGATARVVVSYRRAAYVPPDNNHVRVTFDRQLMGSPYHAGTELQLPDTAVRVGGNLVILELKFTDRFPKWLRELARMFHLVRRSVPKYVKCVDAVRSVPGVWAERDLLEHVS